jgi:hypothetical protein
MLLIEMLQAAGINPEEYHRMAKTLTRMDIITIKK